MHTSAHPTQATCDMHYEGTLCAPVELRLCDDGSYTITLHMHPTASGLHSVVAHVPVEQSESARKQAEQLVARINAAQKHGHNAIILSAPLRAHKLICRDASIIAHESHHPNSATPEKAPAIEKVADLFAEAA